MGIFVTLDDQYQFGICPSPMDRALREVREGRMSERTAATTYGVPRSTLRDRLSGRVRVQPDGSTRPGPSTVLT